MTSQPDDDWGSRLVESALREDPGLRLDPGFADRVVQRVSGVREEFAWFENMAVAVLFMATLLLALPIAVGYVRPILASIVPATANVLAPWESLRWDLLLGAGGALLLVAVVEKFAAPRLRHLLPS